MSDRSITTSDLLKFRISLQESERSGSTLEGYMRAAEEFAAWLGAVLFAFVTNKLLVFESHERSAGGVAKEFLSFLGGRVLSYVLFEFGMVEILYRIIPSLNIRKIIAAVFTIIFNYIVSKFVSFRTQDDAKDREGMEQS